MLTEHRRLLKVIQATAHLSSVLFEAVCSFDLEGPPNEPPHDKTNKMAYAPSEDSDQPGHPPSLIRVFAIRMKKAWAL